ncbi:MAG: triple tyrosine motif-containing protein [Ekhidna sp.]
MKHSLLILFILLSTLLVSHAQDHTLKISKTPLTKYYGPTDYKGGIQNWSFDIDTTGVLFVSNNFGLMEYDGARWNNHNVPISTKLRSVHISKDNKVFIGGQGQIGYFIQKKNRYEFVSLLDKLNSNNKAIEEVWKIIEIDDQIFFNTSNRLIKYQDENIQEVKLDYQIQRIFKVDSSLLVQFENKGLFKFQNGEFELLPQTNGLGEIIAIIDQNFKFICLTSEGGIFEYANEQLNVINTPIDDQLKSATINTAIQLSNGDIAIGTQNEGLFLLDNGYQLKNHFTRNKGLNDRTVLSIKEDDFKNLWVGLNNGINYLELNSPLSLINEEVGLEGTGYAATIYDEKIYLGTNNGLFTKSIYSENEDSYRLIGGTQGQVYNLSIVENDLILNHHKGAFLVKNEKLEQIHNVGSWKFMGTSRKKKFLGGAYDGIHFFDKEGNKWKPYGKVDDLEISSRVFEFQNDSTIWMTHGYKGAYLISLNKTLSETKAISFYGIEEGFPSNVLISVYKIGDNLVLTGETGVYNFDQQNNRMVVNQFLSEWIGDGHISNITSSEDGNIFFIVDRELGYLHQKSFGDYSKESSLFKRINKLLSDDLENITILDERNVLIGATEGFIHFNPSQDYAIIDNFNTLIRNIQVISQDSVTQISGSYFNNYKFQQNNSIKFECASPYFDGVEDIQYSYRLKGFDNKWSNWSKDASKEYTNLPSGKFSFEVKAKNIYDVESKVAQSSFQILPRWYESNLAYVIYVFLVIISFSLISLFQSKKYKKERAQIVQSKEEAIKSKDEELTQASKQSEEKIETLKNDKLKSEIKHKDQELASATMHLLNKNEFVQGVRKKIETLVNDNVASKDELKKILKTIDRNLNEDDSWDQFAFHFDQVHGGFLKKLSEDDIKLTGQETKLAAYLRMNMSSKEIANLMNISIRGVELARYRLRKKLNLDRSVNLVEHLMEV